MRTKRTALHKLNPTPNPNPKPKPNLRDRSLTQAREWRTKRTALPMLGYLVEGAFSSNPCGSDSYLNPLYDFLPRGNWVVEAGVCQRPSDFILDPTSNTLCCPSPDYCCPHAAANCSAGRAAGVVLFDLSTANGGQPVLDRHLVGGWRRHFWAIPKAQGVASLCSAERGEWNGGSRQPPCFWAMNDASVARLREVWSAAPPLARRIYDDDDTHNWRGFH